MKSLPYLLIIILTTFFVGCQQEPNPPENSGTIHFGETIETSGEGITIDGAGAGINKGGNYIVTGTTLQGSLQVRTTEEVTLTLDSVSITNPEGPAISFEGPGGITLPENSNNHLESSNEASLYSKSALQVMGKGTLTIKGNEQQGILAEGPLTIEDAKLEINALAEALYSKEKLTINSGSLTIDSKETGLYSAGNIVVNDGLINILNSRVGLEAHDTLTINKGTLRIQSTTTTCEAGSKVIINNGELYGDSQKNGLVSKGNLTINGGKILLYGGNKPYQPIITGTEGGMFKINGGTLIATGGPLTEEVSNASQQYAIWVESPLKANTLMNIADNNGTSLATFRLPKEASFILYSSKDLLANTTYKISTGGTIEGKAKDGLYSSGTYLDGKTLTTFTTNSTKKNVVESTT